LKPFRKQFNLQQEAFPILLVYKDTKNPQHELPDHLHDWYEIVYIYQGKGTFFIDQTFHDMQQGDVFVIPGNTIHRAIPDQDSPVTSTAIFFSPTLIYNTNFGHSYSYMKLFEKGKKDNIYKYPLDSDYCREIENYIDNMNAENSQTTPDNQHAIVLWLHMILLHLNRNCLPHDVILDTKSKFEPQWLKNILVFIDQHLNDKLDLDFLSKQAAVSPAHFSRVFKQLVGMNVTDYITTKRIMMTKELLLQTNDKIESIAEQCGFQSMPHFYRTFKKYTGMTPTAYRK
jgi:AraC family transcriptional regulator